MTERAPQNRCRLPAPSWCLDGRVATSLPTAARIAAAELWPSAGPASSLHSDVQVCATELAERHLQSASLVPRLDSPPTASSDDSTRTTEPKTLQRPRRNHQRTQHTRLGVLRALIFLPAPGSALLRALAGSFEKRGVTLSPPPLAACGGRGNRYMAQAQGDSFPQNEAPPSHDL